MNENMEKLDLTLQGRDIRLFKKLYNNIQMTDNEKGRAIEFLAQNYFEHFNFNYQKLTNEGFQKLYGDFALLNKDSNVLFVECKSSHTWNSIPKLALDYAYYRNINGQDIEYIQQGSKDNQGYLHYLNADIIFCYNKDLNRIYIIHDFQEVKNNILNLLEKYDYNWDIIGHVSTVEPSIKWDYNIKGKYSRILNLELSQKSIERLGGKLTIYELNNDIIKTDIKKD